MSKISIFQCKNNCDVFYGREEELTKVCILKVANHKQTKDAIIYSNNTNFDFPLSDEGLHDWSFYKGKLFVHKIYSKKCFCYFLCQHSKLFTQA